MKQLAHYLLAAALLTAPACSKNEAQPAESSTAHYLLDGRNVVAPATFSTQTGGGVGTDDLLYIRVADDTSHPEEMVVIYAKTAGAAETSYRPLNLLLTDKSGATSYYSDNLTMTVTKTSSGYSGTFAGRRLASAGGAGTSQISNGVFTNVH